MRAQDQRHKREASIIIPALCFVTVVLFVDGSVDARPYSGQVQRGKVMVESRVVIMISAFVPEQFLSSQ
ncbi:hypothetical protein GYMLUDRAFT_392763 [Collybiopsis luxurians FD-317 M1]|uniref:Uncharacterized protein n=1 Tax=Collybiopsis luxurians FD-317 M1 TaxID=944289 RepID=A0A0D0AMY2_9AGAR|nr:hypothetical protein GYMLUDRAFT_392763 [Collybiopsis luxurians FD-317 M1]